ncbi:hypothetical protein WR25_00757 [Diploscapter pachys]|uniref:Ribosomal protein S17 n=1 Tax=Diploscapter pachys TaxID=2018661 RepID=A0A2A2LEX2_9BILA|nr:hypothetical protein WR25_00757 [Diploscapter pachys]
MPRGGIILKSTVSTEMLIGRIIQMNQIGIDRTPCAQVRCRMNEFNKYLKLYYQNSFDFWAIDSESKGNLGDVVLIKKLDAAKKPKADVSHLVDRVVFKYGNIVDPVTGKRVIRDQFDDEIELRKQLVEEVYEEPLEQDALLFEERRAIQRQKLEEKKTEIEEGK